MTSYETNQIEFKRPTPAETARLLAEARRMRAEAIRSMYRAAIRALAANPVTKPPFAHIR